jgi:predicted RNA-binding Zn-ribbon protein involved in translation (DUF1610 family)
MLLPADELTMICDGCGEEVLPIATGNARFTEAKCPLCGEQHVYEKY